jgi:hypothetical protein
MLSNQNNLSHHTKELKENLTPEDQIYFMDGVHPPHNTIVS